MIWLYGGFCIVLVGVLVIILTPVLASRELSQKQRYQLAGSLFVFFFVAVYAVYYYVGAPEVVELSAARERRMAEITSNITTLLQRVKDNPEDAEAWMGLGENFTLTGQYRGATNAYKEAVKATKGNPKAIVAYAQAMVTEASGQVTDEAAKSLEMALMLEPDNAEARYLMALRKLQLGKNDEAMHDMRQLYYSLPEDAPVKALIDEQIGNKPRKKQP